MKPVVSKEILIYSDKNGRQPFVDWLGVLDSVTRARIENRLLRLELGNYGDFKVLQGGVSELRFKFGSGYRVYFGEDGDKIVVLLSGGDKKTQKKDIEKAKAYWQEYSND